MGCPIESNRHKGKRINAKRWKLIFKKQGNFWGIISVDGGGSKVSAIKVMATAKIQITESSKAFNRNWRSF
jgi:hypothetical protein